MVELFNPETPIRYPWLTNNFLRGLIKRAIFVTKRRMNRMRHFTCGKYVDIGPRFRFSRKHPYRAEVGYDIFIEEFNVWNANSGDIIVGNVCLFGLHNVIMGPLEIEGYFSSGPRVSILGPRHAVMGYEEAEKKKTIFKKNVWVSAGAIIFSGVTVGENVVIGPGAVVSKNVPDNAFMLGNPARDMSKAYQLTAKKS